MSEGFHAFDTSTKMIRGGVRLFVLKYEDTNGFFGGTP
jgi:hypothetical protein